jgi:uncharacterized protein YbbC (DUF1343 family)
VAVIVTDRPTPLPDIVDGPGLARRFECFVAPAPVPFCYGMTPGETARWLVAELELPVDLTVVPMQGYAREPAVTELPWLPPSPAIRTPATAAAYPATVCFEALGAVRFGRGTNLVFQAVGMHRGQYGELAERLRARSLPGVEFHPCRFVHTTAAAAGRIVNGARLTVVDPARYRPALTAVNLVHVCQQLLGKDRLWRRGARPDFFDRLFGTDSVRSALLDDEDPATIAAGWQPGLRRFRQRRQRILLY